MQRLVILVLATALFLAHLKPFAPYLYYTLRYDHIVENFCVNVDKPKLQCNGSCHLASKLKASSEEDHPASDRSKHLRTDREVTPTLIFSPAQTLPIIELGISARRTGPASTQCEPVWPEVLSPPPELS
ncbi:MAG: hypothetical protein AAGN35_12840 [Bacteroidota bacterium]